MKSLFIIGNWKSNKTVSDAQDWLKRFLAISSNTTLPKPINKQVILCVPYLHIVPLQQKLKRTKTLNLHLKLGSQDVSPYSSGAYTGQISAQMLADLVDYCLIGHSERRLYFGEDDATIAKKAEQLLSVNIIPIVCIQHEQTPIPQGVKFIAYEPVWAIGSGKPATSEHAQDMAQKIKKGYPNSTVIYGGSVAPENVQSFLAQPDIDGVLLGGTSLDPETFYQIIQHAQT